MDAGKANKAPMLEPFITMMKRKTVNEPAGTNGMNDAQKEYQRTAAMNVRCLPIRVDKRFHSGKPRTDAR